MKNQLLLLVLSGTCSIAAADSLAPLGAEGIKRASISVTVGNGLGGANGGVVELFGGVHERARRFEASLRSAVEKDLKRNRIAADDKAKSEFGFGFFGRPVGDKRCPERYVVLITFKVWNERYPESGAVVETTRLEAPEDENLESALERGALFLLNETLRARGDQ